MENMARINVMQSELIKRSGIIAASFLIATLATVIAHATPANALLDAELPLGENLSPITDRVNGLVNKSLGLPITINSTDRLKLGIPNVADVEAKIPVVPTLVDTVTEPLTPVVDGVSNTLNPVTDQTIPAIREAFSRQSSSPAPQPSAPSIQPQSGTNPQDTDTAIAGVSISQSSRESTNDNRVASSTPFFAGVATFFASSLPSAVRDIASSIAGKEVGVTPIIISMLLFTFTLLVVIGIIYASNHGGIVTLGRYTFPLLIRGTDRTEMATFIVAAISFGIVAIFLALTSL